MHGPTFHTGIRYAILDWVIACIHRPASRHYNPLFQFVCAVSAIQHNVINEMEMGSPNYNNRNTKMLFSDNGKCLISHKHHHSSKNLCSSQGNSASNTNEDIEERASSSSGRMSANFKENGIKIKRSPERDLTGDGGAFVDGKPSSIFYCISLGDLKTIPSQSSLNYVSARPSFYSDPTRQCDADSKMWIVIFLPIV